MVPGGTEHHAPLHPDLDVEIADDIGAFPRSLPDRNLVAQLHRRWIARIGVDRDGAGALPDVHVRTGVEIGGGSGGRGGRRRGGGAGGQGLAEALAEGRAVAAR